MFAQKIPLAAFQVKDLHQDYERLKKKDVVFLSEPVEMGPVKIAVFSDTCGNLIQLYQPL